MPELSNPTIRYPGVDDKVDVPGDMLELATDVHAAINADRARLTKLETPGGSWQTCTVDKRFSAVSGFTPAVMVRGGVAYLTGLVSWQSGVLASPVVYIPEHALPNRNHILPGVRPMHGTGCMIRLRVSAAGYVDIPSESYYWGATPVVGKFFEVTGSWPVK